MEKRTGIVLSLCITFFHPAITACAPARQTYSVFDYRQHMPAITVLLKKEWSKLFLIPSYDEGMVEKIFKFFRPGDFSQQDKALSIRALYLDEQLVGFVTFYFKDIATGHIELLAIDSAFRGQGLGKFLVGQVAQECMQRGCSILQLYVYRSNPNAIQFYRHLGFAIQRDFGQYLLLSKPIS